MREELSTLLSNRAAAYIADKDYIGALTDAEVVTQIKRPWGKGHFRKARALVELGRYEDAKEAVLLGLAFEPTSTVWTNNRIVLFTISNRQSRNFLLF